MKYQAVAPKSLKNPLEDARSAYTRSHGAAREALATMMGFAQTCFNNWEDFVEFCDQRMIRVRPERNANDYIRVVRAVIGSPELDKDGLINAWVSSDMATSRYAKTLLFADKAHGVNTKIAFLKWLDRDDINGGGGTITDAYNRALTWERSLPRYVGNASGGNKERHEDLRFDRGVEFLS